MLTIGLMILVAMIAFVPQSGQNSQGNFGDGCCLNEKSFPHPKHPISEKLSRSSLLSALNCATNNQFMGNSESLAREMHSGSNLEVAYFYGRYMPEQNMDALTIGVFSRDGSTGYLLDVVPQSDGAISVGNIPPLLKDNNHWRVGEIDGGIWSYTRLYYLAQDIGRLPRDSFSLSDILAHRPPACWVMFEKQWDDLKPKKQP